jgi:hypothetical protein
VFFDESFHPEDIVNLLKDHSWIFLCLNAFTNIRNKVSFDPLLIYNGVFSNFNSKESCVLSPSNSKINMIQDFWMKKLIILKNV